MTHDKHDKKGRKKALLKKNRHDQEIFQAMRLRQIEDDRVQEGKAGQQAKPQKKSDDEQIWSEKVSSIRNRLTGSKRTSKERWNRFAGTGGEGGRGL